jgi:hypothetical protein
MPLCSIVLGLLALLLWLQPVDALNAQYYLHPGSGNDSWAGTSPTLSAPNGPWKTLNKAAASTGQGDVVTILPGSYTSTQIISSGSAPNRWLRWTESLGKGVAGNPITIQATPGTVTIDAQLNDYLISFWPNGVTTAFYVVVKGLTITNTRGGGLDVSGDPTISSAPSAYFSTHVAFLDNRITNVGSLCSAPFGTTSANHIIWQHNSLFNSGDPSIYAAGCGADTSSQHWVYPGHNVQYSVVDGNTFESNSGHGVHYFGNDSAFAHLYDHTIIRRNILINAAVTGMITSRSNFDHTYIYHNTLYQEADPYPAAPWTPSGRASYGIAQHLSTSLQRTIIKNNIVYGYADSGMLFADANSNFNGTLTLDYNLIDNLFDSTKAYNFDGTGRNLTSFKAAYPTYAQHSLQANPQFTNPASPTRDFSLGATSPAKNAGDFLTQATNSGTGSTSLQVADAGYFHDGFGLIAGDTIQVGTGQAPVVVTAVNYSTNTLTLQNARTWTSGTNVSLPYSDTKPDMGALESAVVASPVTVFVDDDAANDSQPCASVDITHPRKTTAGGVTCLTPGSTLYFRAGTYDLLTSATMTIPGGSDWASATTFAAYGGEAVTLRTTAINSSVVQLAAPGTNQYIVFDRLTLDAQSLANTYGLQLNGVSNIRFQNGTIKNATNPCVYTPGSSGIEILASRIFGCDDGVNMGTTTSSLVANNLLYGNNRGVAVRSGSTGVKVYYNSAGNNAVRGLNIVTGAVNTELRGNISFANTSDPSQQILDETGGTSGNVVANNLTTDPAWLNGPANDFHLTSSSTGALNTGVALPEVMTDFEGTVRPTAPGSNPDLGALECGAACAGPPVPPSVSTPLPAPPYITHFLAR